MMVKILMVPEPGYITGGSWQDGAGRGKGHGDVDRSIHKRVCGTCCHLSNENPDIQQARRVQPVHGRAAMRKGLGRTGR